MSISKTCVLVCVILLGLSYALPVDQAIAEAVARSRLVHDGRQDDYSITFFTVIKNDENASVLAYVFELTPAGYVIVGADTRLPPVIAYSYTDLCRDDRHTSNILFDLVQRDMIARLTCTSIDLQTAYKTQWHEYIAAEFNILAPIGFQQWPPEGSTPTGGWLMENWTQTAPYNMYCPMDLIAGQRSVAGCPAVAMGAILNYLEEINGTRFDDGDDYLHNFYETYWIDDDYAAHDFPSWTALNEYMDTLEYHYNNHIPATTSDKAALIYACGAACRQVYSASVSGTYGITQAATAYQRLHFVDSELLYESSDSLFERLSQNMMDAMPAHMGIVDAGPTYGHNIVVDGYNTDDFYHFNFGWSGSYNGWYSFPLTGMPYNMNIIEGIILDIGEGQPGVAETDDIVAGNSDLSLGVVSNPVRSDLNLCMTLQQASHVNLALYDVTGRRVSILADRNFSAGSHRLYWNADRLAAGVYIVGVKSTQGTVSEKIIVLE
ncbi:MAG: C10 family peptidase [candidate division WOR-3 bacterium]|nr:MAG: C10 family peptidase [candidate division WOR-3 bacterium]